MASGGLPALRHAFDALGLNVWLPVGEAAFDAAVEASGAAPGTRLGVLLPGAKGAVLIGSGGRRFFDVFLASPEARAGRPDPLDAYTARGVHAACADALPVGRYRVYFPFLRAPSAGTPGAHLPFQRLGQAAGLPPPGPLGLTVHPTFGPWWAYRALLVFDDALTDPALPTAAPDQCRVCPAPCVAACPSGATSPGAFDFPRCHAFRHAPSPSPSPCVNTCLARRACPVGTAHAYTDAQLAFHMRAVDRAQAAVVPLGGARRLDPPGTGS